MSSLLRAVVGLSVSGTVLAGLVLLVTRLLKGRVSQRFGYYIWLLVLARLCIPLPGLVRLPSAPAPPPVSVSAAAPAASGPDIQMPGPAEPPPAVRRNDGALWTAAWLAGGAVCLSWQGAGYARFVRRIRASARTASHDEEAALRRLARGKRVGLLVSPAASTPLLMGLFRPVIVLPERRWEDGQLDFVLRHELTHLRRHDLLYKWAAALIFGVHWFNPALRLVERELARRCELSCDEQVVQAMSAGERQRYGETLLALAACPKAGGGLTTAMSGEKKRLKERLEWVMKRQKHTVWLALLAALGIAGCGVLLGAASAPEPPARTAGLVYQGTTYHLDSAEAELEAAGIFSLEREDGRLVFLSTQSAEAQTPAGIRVGSTREEVLAAYGIDSDGAASGKVKQLWADEDEGDRYSDRIIFTFDGEDRVCDIALECRAVTWGESEGAFAAERLLDSLTCEGGRVTFQVPEGFDGRWAIYICGRVSMGTRVHPITGTRTTDYRSVHYLDGVAWTGGESYGFELLKGDYTELTMDVALPDLGVELTADLLPLLNQG